MAARRAQPATLTRGSPRHVVGKVASYPWRSVDPEVVEWSRRAYALVKQLSSCDDHPNVDIDTKTHIDDAPSETRSLKCEGARSLTGTLLQQPHPGPWHEEKLQVPQNAVCPDAHYQRTRRLIEQISGRRQQGASLKALDLSGISDESKVSLEDVVVTVLFHDPKGCKEQEHDILASQTLEDLRDACYFVGDLTYDGPSRLGSACMFIDGAFYVDTRQASAVDYSVELIEWLQTLDTELREQKSRPMSTRICDLERIPFGEPCCFIRQGDIEHQMYFTGARLLNPRVDCPLREGYPCLIWMRKYHRRCCVACRSNLASWVVLDSSRCPLNPAHFCNFCFKHFSERRDGSYIPPIDYKAFPYLHDEV